MQRYGKHARLPLIMSKIPPELLRQGPTLERDLERHGEGFDVFAHWTHFKRRTSLSFAFSTHARPVGKISGPFPWTGVFTLDNLVWLRQWLEWLAAGRVERRRCAMKFSSSPCWSIFCVLVLALGILAGEHSPL